LLKIKNYQYLSILA